MYMYMCKLYGGVLFRISQIKTSVTELLHLVYYYESYKLDLNILIIKMVEFKLATRWSEFVTRELALVNYGLKLVIRRLLLLSRTFKSKFAFFYFNSWVLFFSCTFLLLICNSSVALLNVMSGRIFFPS